jgi:phenylacetate-CoA oxygenase PaaI subunit
VSASVRPTPEIDFDGPTTAALRRHVLTLADSKRLLGIRYSDWLLGAPSIETGIAASGMAQDEWGHARLLYAMLKNLNEDPVAVEHDRAADAYASLDALDGPFEDWAAVVAAMVVVDGALTLALEAFAEGAYEPARARVPKMVAEEDFHRDLGSAWLRRLASGSGDAPARLKAAAEAFLPSTLAWLAPADATAERLAAAGVTATGDALLVRFRERYAEVLAPLGIDVYMVEPRREGWDEDRGRGSGHPAEEAVERARGDRNRALFVE